MSANFHTPIPVSMSVTTANLESPLSELDSAIGDLRDGATDFHQLNLGSFSSKTISSGSFSVNTSLGDRTLITLDTQGGAATDDLDLIQGGTVGDILYLKSANTSRIITIKSGVSNIRTYNDNDIILNTQRYIVPLIYDGSNWLVVPITTQKVDYPQQTATISSGSVNAISSFMEIDTQGAASTDDLDFIGGITDGAIVFLKIANDSRLVVVKHNTGNIKTVSGFDYTIRSSERFLMFIYDTSDSFWYMQDSSLTLYDANNNSLNSNAIQVPVNSILTANHPFASANNPFLDIMPMVGNHQVRMLSAADTTLEGFGFGTITVSGTPSNVYNGNDSPIGSFVRWQSAASSGSFAGVRSPFKLTDIGQSFYFRIIFSTHTSLTNCRFWVGLASNALVDDDLPTSPTSDASFAGIRFSTNVPDTNWQFVTASDPAGSETITDSGILADTDTTYDLVIQVDFANSEVKFYFRPYLSSTYTEFVSTDGEPAVGESLGLNARVETLNGSAKSILIHSVALYH